MFLKAYVDYLRHLHQVARKPLFDHLVEAMEPMEEELAYTSKADSCEHLFYGGERIVDPAKMERLHTKTERKLSRDSDRIQISTSIYSSSLHAGAAAVNMNTVAY